MSIECSTYVVTCLKYRKNQLLDILDPFKNKGHKLPPEGRKDPDRDTNQRAGTQNDHLKGTLSGAVALAQEVLDLKQGGDVITQAEEDLLMDTTPSNARPREEPQGKSTGECAMT
jgi:hypothetical protein